MSGYGPSSLQKRSTPFTLREPIPAPAVTPIASLLTLDDGCAAHVRHWQDEGRASAWDGHMQRDLRISVMRGGCLIDDRFVTEDVTIGQHALFRMENGRPVLHVRDGVVGELALDGRSRASLAALESHGQPEEGGWRLSLPDEARGWVRMGPLTFYIQLEPRPLPVPVKLPPGTRAGLMSGLETGFLAVLVAVISLEGLGIYATHRHQVIEDPDNIEAWEPSPLVIPAAPRPPDAPRPHPAAPAVSGRGVTPPHTSHPSGDVREQASRTVDQLFAGSAMQEIVGHDDQTEVAEVFDHMQAKRDFADADRLPNTPRHSTDDGPVPLDGPGGLPLLSPRPSHDPQVFHPIHPPPVPIGTGPLMPPGGIDLVPESFLKFLKRKVPTLKACYDKQLRLEPSLHGKMTLSFVVTSDGRITEISPEEDSLHSAEVTDCIRLVMTSWRVAPAPGEETPVSLPLVFAPVGLRPSGE